MAIYHFHASMVSRNKGQTATAACAYRAGTKIRDRKTGLSFNYSKKKHIAHLKILAPKNSPKWVFSRTKLWNSVEMVEKRKDAQVARELQISLPKELSLGQQVELIEHYCQKQFVEKGMVADIAIHNNPGNPHAHVMLTTRQIDENGFGKKQREWNDKELLEQWRSEWALAANESLGRAGFTETIDHRSLEVQQQEAKLLEDQRSTFDTDKEEKMADNISTTSNTTPGGPCLIRMSTKPNPVLDQIAISRMKTMMYWSMLALLFDEPNLSRDKNEEDDHDEGADWFRFITIAVLGAIIQDHGNFLLCQSGNQQEITMALQVANLKGWKSFHMEGPEQFCEEVFKAAIQAGFQVEKLSGYQPTQKMLDWVKESQAQPKQTTRMKVGG